MAKVGKMLICSLIPSLEKLVDAAPTYGEIVLRATLHQGQIAKVRIEIEEAKRLAVVAAGGKERG